MVRVGILGAAGYTGGELIRLLINHPEAEIVFANSESNAGNKVYDVHEGLIGDTELEFTSEMPFDKVDVGVVGDRCLDTEYGHRSSESVLIDKPYPPKSTADESNKAHEPDKENPRLLRIAKIGEMKMSFSYVTCLTARPHPAAKMLVSQD